MIMVMIIFQQYKNGDRNDEENYNNSDQDNTNKNYDNEKNDNNHDNDKLIMLTIKKIQ